MGSLHESREGGTPYKKKNNRKSGTGSSRQAPSTELEREKRQGCKTRGSEGIGASWTGLIDK